MNDIWSALAASAALAIVVLTSIASPALAIDAALAKQCRTMAIHAHPPASIGSKQGTAQAERKFFQDCISNKSKATGEDGRKSEAPPQK